jgi:hypothetical protein
MGEVFVCRRLPQRPNQPRSRTPALQRTGGNYALIFLCIGVVGDRRFSSSGPDSSGIGGIDRPAGASRMSCRRVSGIRGPPKGHYHV